MNERFSYNYLNEKNNIKIISCSSYNKLHPIENILKDDLKLIWLSEKDIPQNIIIDISHMKKRPKNNKFSFFGIYLWHSYKNNPQEIELYFSDNNSFFTLVGIYELEFRNGIQLFQIDNNNFLNSNINFLKIKITKTYGGNLTYINQIFLLDSYDKYFRNIISLNDDNNIIENNTSENNNVSEINFNKLRKQINDSIIQEKEKKKKQFEKIFNSDKVLRKYNLNKLKKNKVDKQFFSHNNSISKNKNQIKKRNLDNISDNISFPSSNSNYKSSDSTNFTTLKIKNNLEKKSKLSLKDILNNQLNDMNNFINSFDKNKDLNKKFIFSSPIKNSINYFYDSNKINDNKLNERVNNIEKTIDLIQKDLIDIKYSIYNINDKKINNNCDNLKQKNLNNNLNLYKNYLENHQKKKYKSSNTSYYKNIDNKLNEKLEDLTDNIEHQIIKNMIEPSIRKFKNKMRRNFSEMKKEINKINYNKKLLKKNASMINCLNGNSSDNSNNNKINKMNSDIDSLYSSNFDELNFERKYNKISHLSNLLYFKLKEKEKILNEKIKKLKK